MHQNCHLVDLSGGAITPDVFNDDAGSQLISTPKLAFGLCTHNACKFAACT
jgi:hypothetical protein